MGYSGKVISGDCHVDIPWMPSDLFTSNAPAHLKDKVPYVKETNEGMQWFTDGTLLGWVAGAAVGLKPGGWDPYVPGISKRLDRMEQQGFFSDGQKGLFHPTTPELRIKDQETDGISGEVLYGILGVAGGEENFDPFSEEYGISDPEVLTYVYDTYNEWAADFCRTNPNRFKGLACLNAHDPKVAARQMRRAAELGLKGAEMNVASAEEPIYQEEWDVLWDAASETGLPISFHTIGLAARYPKAENKEKYHWMVNALGITLFQLAGAELLTSIIYSKACDRFPNLKFVLGECGAGWVPYMLHRMDEGYEKWLFHMKLSTNPSEVWRNHGYTTFQHEFLTNEMVSLMGEDNVIWGSDYPHPDGIWPDSRRVIDEQLGQLDEKYIRKIVCENTATLYGFDI